MKFGRSIQISLFFAGLMLFAISSTTMAAPWLIGSSQLGELFFIDVASGAAASIGTMPFGLSTEIEIANGTVWAEGFDGNTEFHAIDLATASSLGFVSHLPGALNGLDFVGCRLYGTFIFGADFPSYLVVVDPSTGNLAPIGLTGFGPISGLAYDYANGVMYGVTAGTQPANLVTIDLNTGAATLVGPILDPAGNHLHAVGSIEFAADGGLYGGLTGNAGPLASFLIRIDPNTGNAIPIGDTGFSITGLARPLVAVDIRPGSCPNPLNIGSKGVLPVAIVGTNLFNVNSVDPASVQLMGVAPVKWEIMDSTELAPCDAPCFEAEPTYSGDGIPDLVVYFDVQAIASALGAVSDGDMLSLPLTGKLVTGTPIEGSDEVIIKAKGKPAPSSQPTPATQWGKMKDK